MQEVRTQVNTYIVRAHCDCGGEYTPDGMVYTTYPPRYPHHCSDCGERNVFNYLYPRTVME